MNKLIEAPVRDTISFLVKVALLSALLSIAIKYGGPLLSFTASPAEDLDGLVTVVVLLPSVVIGAGLLIVLKTR